MLVAKAMAEINQMAKANEEKCNIAKIHVVAVGRRTPYVDEIQAYLKEQSIEHLSTSIIRYLTKTCHPSISWHAVLPILLASRVSASPCSKPSQVAYLPSDAQGLAWKRQEDLAESM